MLRLWYGSLDLVDCRNAAPGHEPIAALSVLAPTGVTTSRSRADSHEELLRMTTNLSLGRIPSISGAPVSDTAADLIGLERSFGARNYSSLPVVLAQGEGSWVADVDGNRYLDLMSAYSAVSFGHSHPKIVGALVAQAQRLGVTSRAYFNNRLPPLFERLAQLTGLDRVLPSNGGAEAVETAIKAARKWGHKVKGIADGHAEIIGCRNNFHGRTIAITGLSTEPQHRDGFGPLPPGLSTV